MLVRLKGQLKLAQSITKTFIFPFLPPVSFCDHKSYCATMNTFTPADFDFTFLEEGFCARDIVEQKLNESSNSVRRLSCFSNVLFRRVSI